MRVGIMARMERGNNRIDPGLHLRQLRRWGIRVGARMKIRTLRIAGLESQIPTFWLVAVAVEFAAVTTDVEVFAAEFATLVASGGIVAAP